MPELRVGNITVRLLSVDLSATPLERQYAMAAIAQEWLLPESLSAPEACAQVSYFGLKKSGRVEPFEDG
ncbi:MAG: hypothetical protein ACLP3C_03690 [Mycobacterium sp.]|uniref:hypothetical protein n=1 Tax=Mycobacterium sp. TaxID=1785 RepID=UPI003F9B0C4E